MKKVYLLLLMFFFVNLNVSAQIQRKFFDFELGKTTKSEVKRYLRQKDKYIEEKDDDTIYSSELRFGGFNWNFVAFSFCKGTLCMVYFSESDNHTARETLDALYKRLSTNLENKYQDYKRYDMSNDEETVYVDLLNNTSLSLKYDYFRGYKGISLTYSDFVLRSDSYREERDEL